MAQNNDTLIIAGAIGLGIYFLKDSLKDLTKPVGEIANTANDYLQIPIKTAETIRNVYNNTTESVKNYTESEKIKSSTDRIIAEGERVQTTLNLGKGATLISASRVASAPTQQNINNLKATVAVQNARDTGILTPGLISLGSKPVKSITETQSTYSKIDAKIGGILPGGVKPNTIKLIAPIPTSIYSAVKKIIKK